MGSPVALSPNATAQLPPAQLPPAQLPPAQLPNDVADKLETLRHYLGELDGLIVGFSGGVDSALLLKVAVEVLGERVVALTAVSASLPRYELDEAVALAQRFGARHELVDSREIDDPNYAANPTNRCFYCKQTLFTIAEGLKQTLGIAHVAVGTNIDDLGDHRPGLDAARKHGALQPLVEAGFTKDDVRVAARSLSIEIWDKPAHACLSSRFPYGIQITERRLNRVEACELLLRQQGFRVFRVRFHDDLVRIELGLEELARIIVPAVREAVVVGCREAGFRYVSVDLEPYRSGRLNEGVVT